MMVGAVTQEDAPEDVPSDVASVKLWLHRLRIERGMTQKELATIAGVSTRTIINLEDPDAGLTTGLPLIKVLRELGVLHGAPIRDQPTLSDRLDAIESMVRTLGQHEAEQETRLQELEQELEILDPRSQKREPPSPDERNQQNG